MGVASLALFGSVARNEAEGDSDVDILVSFDRPVGFFHFLEVKDYLETVLKTRVDLVTEDALKKQLRERILAEAVRAA
jgi:predicted nucleotidyltransferase